MNTRISQSNQNFDDDLTEQTQLDEFVERLEPILKHITPHRFLCGFTLVCGLVAWNRGLMLLYGLVAFLLAVLIVSHLFRVFNLRGLQIQGHFTISTSIRPASMGTQQPLEIFVDEPISVQLYTNSRFSKHFLHVTIPIYRVTQVHTFSTLTKVQESQMFILNTKGEEQFDNELQLRRGVYRLQSAQLQCAYPFGLLKTDKRFSLKQADSSDINRTSSLTNTKINTSYNDELNTDLYVLPRSFSINSLPVDTAHSNGQDEITSSKKGGCDEVMDIRPYRRGDAFKSVHWGASARQVSRGKDWMVKEQATFDTPRLLIVLNQFDVSSHSAMDAMLATTLAVSDYFTKIGYQVDLFGYDGSSQSLSDFWQMKMNSGMPSANKDKLRKLAEIDSIASYIYRDANVESNSNGNSKVSNLNSVSNNKSTLNNSFNNSVLKTASYDDALQSVMSNQSDANVLLSFYSHSPANSGGSVSSSQAKSYLMADKMHYQVVINRHSKSVSGYRKRSNFIHEFQLNANESLAEWEAVFKI